MLKKFLPKLKKHLEYHSIDTAIYALKWFFQCFLDRVRRRWSGEAIVAPFLNRVDPKNSRLPSLIQMQVPFSLALRVWDLYLLEGERVLIGMAYNILRIHRRYLMRQGMDELLAHLQVRLAKDFGYEDDVVIEKLREVMHELRSNRLDWPGEKP